MLKTMKTLIYFSLFSVVFHAALSVDAPASCQCGNSPCQKLQNLWDPLAVEVMIAGNSSNDIETIDQWRWNSFTSVLDYNEEVDDSSRQMMCRAHKEGKRYAIYVDYHPDIDANETVIGNYTTDIVNKINQKYADIVALNLLTVLGKCDYTKDHVQPITNALGVTFAQLKKTNVKVLCVLPWRPPCIGQDCGVTTFLSRECDVMVLAIDSYFSFCDDACIAKATTQASKISFGVTEYEAFGFRSTQILLGISWHGYNYTCVSYTDGAAHGICRLKKDDQGVCDVEGSRRVVRIGHEPQNVRDLAYQNNSFSNEDQSPYKVDTFPKEGNATEMVTYMTWYENVGSLFYKYDLAKAMHLKGVVIFYGDDLTYTHLNGDKFNDNMWAWILHDLMVANSTIKKSRPNTAGLMAGIGVAMFLLGTLLGAIISCIILRRKRSLKPPFSRDPLDVNEFRDDENNAL